MWFGSESKAGGTSGWDSLFLAGICLFFLGSKLAAHTAAAGSEKSPSGLRILAGHVPAALAWLTPVGELPASRHLDLAISLPVRNHDRLQQLLREIYDPGSPNYRHYLTPEQFRDQFGASESDYALMVAFAQSNHLAIKATQPNRLVLDVSGTVTEINQAFHLALNVYSHPTENRTFFAPGSEPMVDSGLPILRISGLDDYSLPHPNFKSKPLGQTPVAKPLSGSGPSGTYAGNDFRSAYVPGTSLTGAGQSVGLLEFDGYHPSDITAYETQIGLVGGGPQLVVVPVDGGVSSVGSGNGEVALDIEVAIAMAPGLSKIYVYEAHNPSPWVDLLSKMANDNLARQLSCSWGGGGPDPACEAIFQQMALQGQSFFNASGDSDAFTGAVPFPSESPNITQVGGTTLTTGAGAIYSSETVWNWGHGTGSGGGISTTYSIPGWQQNVSMAANQGSTTMRNMPDVALTADNVFEISDNGVRSSVGGTSCAAPLWAAFTALVNQRASAAGQPQMGFLNPALYAIGAGPNYAACFKDTTAGNNTSSHSRTKYYAVTGYDLCTGWGTPNGTNLINALVPIQTPMVAAFTGSPTIGAAPLSVTFADTSSGNINNRFWDFGNGFATNTTATRFVFNYSSPGTNTVILSVSGAAGTNTLSRSAYIIVTNPATTTLSNSPSITAQPQNQVLLAGSDATFTVRAAGADPLAYQWRFNTTNILGANGTTYVRSNVQPFDRGLYDVIVTNSFGSIKSSNATLSVVNHPLLLTPAWSSNGAFTFLLSGDAGFSYAIEGSTNLSDWSIVATLPNPAGLVPFADTNSQSLSFRAYRARLLP